MKMELNKSNNLSVIFRISISFSNPYVHPFIYLFIYSISFQSYLVIYIIFNYKMCYLVQNNKSQFTMVSLIWVRMSMELSSKFLRLNKRVCHKTTWIRIYSNLMKLYNIAEIYSLAFNGNYTLDYRTGITNESKITKKSIVIWSRIELKQKHITSW